MGVWQKAREKYEGVVEAYGWTAVSVYLVLFIGTWFGFWFAIKQGFEVDGAAQTAGTIGSAYVATKLTQPVRLVATAVLTPFVVAVWRRIRGTHKVTEEPAISER